MKAIIINTKCREFTEKNIDESFINDELAQDDFTFPFATIGGWLSNGDVAWVDETIFTYHEPDTVQFALLKIDKVVDVMLAGNIVITSSDCSKDCVSTIEQIKKQIEFISYEDVVERQKQALLN